MTNESCLWRRCWGCCWVIAGQQESWRNSVRLNCTVIRLLNLENRTRSRWDRIGSTLGDDSEMTRRWLADDWRMAGRWLDSESWMTTMKLLENQRVIHNLANKRFLRAADSVYSSASSKSISLSPLRHCECSKLATTASRALRELNRSASSVWQVHEREREWTERSLPRTSAASEHVVDTEAIPYDFVREPYGRAFAVEQRFEQRSREHVRSNAQRSSGDCQQKKNNRGNVWKRFRSHGCGLAHRSWVRCLDMIHRALSGG